MAVKKPISLQKEETEKDLEKKREEFIRGAGMVASDIVNKPKTKWTKLCLRIKVEALQKIDDEISQKLSGTRTSWILDAIEEKLKAKEQNDLSRQTRKDL